jgi:hypothetical protein
VTVAVTVSNPDELAITGSGVIVIVLVPVPVANAPELPDKDVAGVVLTLPVALNVIDGELAS